MQIETYEEISLDVTADGTVENELVSAEAIALVDVLGLEGQARFTKTETLNDGEQIVRRLPYREVTAQERAVFKALFPQQTPLKKFNQAPIPLRVLQVAAHANEMFDELIIWHTERVSEDPILIGLLQDPQRSWVKREYILARWGDVLHPMETLITMAKKKLLVVTGAKIKKNIAELQRWEATLESSIDSYLATGDGESLYVNVSFQV